MYVWLLLISSNTKLQIILAEGQISPLCGGVQIFSPNNFVDSKMVKKAGAKRSSEHIWHIDKTELLTNFSLKHRKLEQSQHNTY